MARRCVCAESYISTGERLERSELFRFNESVRKQEEEEDACAVMEENGDKINSNRIGNCGERRLYSRYSSV